MKTHLDRPDAAGWWLREAIEPRNNMPPVSVVRVNISTRTWDHDETKCWGSADRIPVTGGKHVSWTGPFADKAAAMAALPDYVREFK